jgi:glycosyltransferase involved in cell wall biosynthesis
MKVFVWSGGHTMVESLLLDPPEGVEIVSNTDVGDKTRARLRSVPRTVRKLGDEFAYSLGVPRFLPTISSADLIHTISGLVPIMPKPWVSSISMPSSFFGLHDDWCQSPRRVRMLRRILQTRNCKKIMSFSDATLKGLKRQLGSSIPKNVEKKLELVYPAANPERYVQKKPQKGGTFKILFVGNHFFDKGGREIHRAVSRLIPRYDVQLDLVADAPLHHKEAFANFVKSHDESWVRWHVPGVPRKELIDRYYPEADVFAMCSYMEVFGFVFIEAMASGLPVIAANSYAQREIVDHGANGFLIDVPITPYEGEPQERTSRSESIYRRQLLSDSLFDGVVDQLETRLRTLIEDSRVRENMGRKSLEMTTRGRFSVQTRNCVLKRIYEEAAPR